MNNISQKTKPSQYNQIAEDIAHRIDEGAFKEGDRLYGRSLMSSEYGVSPETIRRAFRLLSDMKVIEVKAQSGAYVLSQDNARRYLSRLHEKENNKGLYSRLNELLEAQNKLSQELAEVTSTIRKRQETLFSSKEQSFNVGEVKIAHNSWTIGKNIGGLAFWQSTGATIIGIRRGQGVMVSPGPNAELYEDDCIIYVANNSMFDNVEKFVNKDTKECESND